MSRKRFVATAAIDEPAISILERVAPLETAPSPDEDAVMGMLDGMIGLVCRGEGGATKRLIDAADSLKVIGRTGAGYDSVDIAAATARKIPVVRAPVSGFAVAEGALAMLLSLVKLLPMADRIVKEGQWQKRYECATGDMADRTLGIIGLGNIGLYLAKLLRPFDMKVLACDPYADPAAAREVGVELVGLEELLGQSDYVSVHVPLMDETRGLIDAERLAMMKKGAILVNTSRGAVVESLDVLADALDSGQLQSVGLDVFPTEPPDSSHRIFQDPRCLCAPHLVGASKVGMERIYRTMAEGMVAVLEGGRPEFCVNPEVFG